MKGTKVLAHFDFPNGIVRYQDLGSKKFYKDKERQVTDEDRQLVIGDQEGTDPDPDPNAD